jgi:archaellum biogenesis ATPase FlaH
MWKILSDLWFCAVTRNRKREVKRLCKTKTEAVTKNGTGNGSGDSLHQIRCPPLVERAKRPRSFLHLFVPKCREKTPAFLLKEVKKVAELKIHTFDEISEEKVGWLWKPYIAFGKITVIQGDPGNGKTALAIAIAALVSKRRKMPTGNAPTFIGNVIYQSGEDNPQDTIKPRLIACGADCAKIAFIEADGTLSPEMLEEAIIGTNSKLVVLDPLQAFLTGRQDINRTKDIRPILRDLGNVAARTGSAIVIIGHMNKGEKSKGIYRGLGSIDITAAARSVLLIGKRKEDPNTRFLTQIKNNLSSFGKAVSFTINGKGGIEFIGECDVSEHDLLSTTLPKKSKFQAAREIVTAMLAEGDQKSNEIYDACLNEGINSGTMQHVKKKLGIKSIRKIDDWYWTLNPAVEDTDNDDTFNGVFISDEPVDDIKQDLELDNEPDDSDEAEGVFLDMANISDILKQPTVLPKPGKVTMQSSFGELTLIDWRAAV